MTLPASGTLTSTQIAAEFGSALPLDLTSAEGRFICSKPSGDVVMPDDFHGKQSVKIVHSVADAGGGSPHTFSAVNFGIAFTDRKLIACICLHGTAAAPLDISAVTIGGIAATGFDAGEFLGGGPANGVGVFVAAVPAGTSGSVVVTWSGQSADAAGLILLAVSDIPTTPFNSTDEPHGGGGSSISDTLNIPANGVLVCAAVHSNSNDTTLTGVTERAEINVGVSRFAVGFDNRMSVQSGRTVSASWSGSAARGFIAQSFVQG